MFDITALIKTTFFATAATSLITGLTANPQTYRALMFICGGSSSILAFVILLIFFIRLC